MPKSLIKSRLFPNKIKKIKLELKITKSALPPNLQTFNQKILSGNGFLLNKRALKVMN